MKLPRHPFTAIWSAAVLSCLLLPTASNASLTALVKRIQPAVVTVVTYDSQRAVKALGTGFFVDGKGHLITNHHVLKGAFQAEIKTRDGFTFPIESVVSENEDADLVKVRVRMPSESAGWVEVTSRKPEIAEQIVVVGNPLGLEQTVSEGIVSAIREMPGLGMFFQVSAPISQGSSGSPVVNGDGKVIGVISFMLAAGQNLNFAVSGQNVLNLSLFEKNLSIAEWTYRSGLQSPSVAQDLCRQGFGLSINGAYAEALDYYKSATEEAPGDLKTWYGLGSCYIGLNEPDKVIETYQKAIEANPDDAGVYYQLGRYYLQLERVEDAVSALEAANRLETDKPEILDLWGIALGAAERYEDALNTHRHLISIRPDYAPAYFNMGISLSFLGRYTEAVEAYKNSIRIRPGFAPAYSQLGVAYAQLGKPGEAMSAQKEAIRISPEYGPAHFHMGKGYMGLGDKAAALAEYRILQKIDAGMAQELFNLIYE